jgi:hypothetical protein
MKGRADLEIGEFGVGIFAGLRCGGDKGVMLGHGSLQRVCEFKSSLVQSEEAI